jgi:hypothetical protein
MNDSEAEQDHVSRPRPNWMVGLLIVAAGCVVAWLLVAHMSSPLPAAGVLIVAVGAVLYRFAHANAVGVVLCCLATAALSVMQWALFPDDAKGLATLCALLGGSFLLVSGLVFLGAAAKNRAGQPANCGGCVLALSTLIAWIAVGFTMHRELRLQEDPQETTHTLLTVHKLAQDVEAIRTRLDRLPTSEQELVRLRGKPMPRFGAGHYPISYERNGNVDYRLHFHLTTFWGYRWNYFVAYYQGPNAAPRLFVDLF